MNWLIGLGADPRRRVGFILEHFPAAIGVERLFRGESPATISPVRRLTCAHGFSRPKFQTTTATTFFPGLSQGAISTVSKRQ